MIIINILYISITSEMGGGPKHIYDLIKNSKKKYNISIAVPNNGIYFNKYKQNVDKTFDIKLKPFNIISFYKLIRITYQYNISIVHSHGKGAGIYSRLLKLFHPKLKIVHTFHGIHYEKYNYLIKVIYILIEKMLKFLTDSFIAVSKSELKQGENSNFLDFNKTSIISNGINLDLFNNELDNLDNYEPANISNKLSENDFIIGNISRFDKQKGHIYLINSFEKLVSEKSNCKLLLVGDGPLRAEIESLVYKKKLNNKVIFLGYRNDIPKIIKMFDIFVFSSLGEGLPFVLLEVLASKVPIVATNVSGNNDIIKDGYNGLLAAPCDSEDLFKKIVKMINEKEKWDKYKDNGFELIKKKYTIEKMVRRTFKLYDNIFKDDFTQERRR